jgi:predicted O-methyltransferase YrrM
MYCRWYWAVARVLQPQSIGEIGVRLGYSLLSLIKGSEHKPQIYGWDNESYIAGSLKVTREGLHAYGIEDVAFQRADSQQLNDLGIASRLDLFSVDGNHTQTGALHDLHLALPTLKSGGYILLDDVTYVHDVCKAAWQFVEEMRLEYHFLPTMRGALLMQKNKSI